MCVHVFVQTVVLHVYVNCVIICELCDSVYVYSRCVNVGMQTTHMCVSVNCVMRTVCFCVHKLQYYTELCAKT